MAITPEAVRASRMSATILAVIFFSSLHEPSIEMPVLIDTLDDNLDVTRIIPDVFHCLLGAVEEPGHRITSTLEPARSFLLGEVLRMKTRYPLRVQSPGEMRTSFFSDFSGRPSFPRIFSPT